MSTTPNVSWALGSEASLSFRCPQCGTVHIFYGERESQFLQGVVDGLLEEHAGHDFVMVEQSVGKVKEYKSTKVQEP